MTTTQPQNPSPEHEFVQDAYGNPALVVSRSGGWTSITQLAGSDFGRRAAVRTADERPVVATEWTLRRVEELAARKPIRRSR